MNELHQAVRALDVGVPPHLLGYTAVARMNPYQSLLYRAFGEAGVAAAPVLRGFDFNVLPEFSGMTRSQTIHFHWINWVIGVAEDAERARTKARGFLGRVDRLKARGASVVWTAHNLYPHDATYVEEELELQQGLADRADVVHVMSGATTTAMAGLLEVDPAKVIISPHPSYVGAYENYISRSDARAALGIDADETVFLIFGALKSYKGLHEFLDAFQFLCARSTWEKYRLVVAGHPDDDPDVRAFVDRCLLDPNVLIEPARIPGQKAQYYLNAADVGAVTYTRSLNSGAALLYLSFGLPVIATDTPVFREALPANVVRLLREPASLGAAEFASELELSAELAHATPPGVVVKSIAHLHSHKVSQAFCAELGQHLGW
ncbi:MULTISPECIES: glycosyltransferase [Kocuria]|uniref:glycosyltransferase n=1 Tax=Kocuria TaxID=57493 RepID=UPI0013566CB6|nr:MULTISPECIES: glycosyltransferase [Kocuria]